MGGLVPKKLPEIPIPNRLKLRKTLSAPGLLTIVRKEFEQIPDHRGGKPDYPLPDVLMSALAVFGLKYSSLLQFDTNRHEKTVKENLTKLYGVKASPSDTQMRTVLDPVKPKNLRSSFTKIHRQVQRYKVLEEYKYLGGYIDRCDGTGQFSSNHLSCKDCCCKTLRNGSIQYYHQLLAAAIVHPHKSTVFPLFPEAITRQDGFTKNDCERNAAKRLLPAIREAFPQLKLIVVEDALSSNAPHLRILQKLSMSYIIVAKPSDHAYMMNTIEQRMVMGKGEQFDITDADGTIRHYRFINQVPLNASNPELLLFIRPIKS